MMIRVFNSKRLYLGIAALLILINACSFMPSSKGPTKDKPGTAPSSNSQMSQAELQALVIAYANRFIATIGQASIEFEKRLPTPEARLIASSRRVYSLMAVAEIAAGPNSGAALLDMMVITSLSRVVWDEYWRPQVFGMPASVIVDAYKKLEKDIWTQASKVMTPPQRQELREILQEWWINHPKQYAVDYIRFSDFGTIGKKPNLKQIQKPGGLLAPIKEATKAVDEVRMTSERAMFLLTKMQLIANFQLEMAYRNILFQPETQNLMKNIDQFSETAKGLENLMETLPQQAARERSIIIEEVSALIQRERKALLNSFSAKENQAMFEQVNATLKHLDKSLVQLNQGLAAADQVVKGSEKTGKVFTKLVQALDRLTAKFQTAPSDPPGKPFDINDYIQAMKQLETSSEKLQNLLSSMNTSTKTLSTTLLTEINQSTEKQVDHLFYRLVQLCLIIGLMVLGLIFISNRLRKKGNI